MIPIFMKHWVYRYTDLTKIFSKQEKLGEAGRLKYVVCTQFDIYKGLELVDSLDFCTKKQNKKREKTKQKNPKLYSMFFLLKVCESSLMPFYLLVSHNQGSLLSAALVLRKST